MSAAQPKRETPQPQSDHAERTTARLALGEAWMMCNQCGAKLYSFDGDRDGDRGCPYWTGRGCEPR